MTPETSVAQTTKQKARVVNVITMLHAAAICVCNWTSASKPHRMDMQADPRTALDVKNYGWMQLLNRKFVLQTAVGCDSKNWRPVDRNVSSLRLIPGIFRATYLPNWLIQWSSVRFVKLAVSQLVKNLFPPPPTTVIQNMKVHYPVTKTPTCVHILSQISPFYSLPPHF
jgi:hypothetical protein